MRENKWILIWTIATFSPRNELHVIPTINPSSNTAHGTRRQRRLNGYGREGKDTESAGARYRDINLLEKEDEHPQKLIRVRESL